MTVRLAPAFKPESQVNLALLKDGTTRAEFVVADQNVFYRSNELLKAGVEARADELAKKNGIRRYSLTLPTLLLKEWRRGFIEALDPTFRALDSQPLAVTLDGDTYEVSYSRAQSDLHFTFVDAGNPSQLLTWAKAVHMAAEKMAVASNQ